MKASVGVGLILALSLALFNNAATAGQQVGDFALIDHNGRFQHMAWYDDSHAIVIAPMINTASDADKLRSLQNRYEQQGVQFFLLNPGLHTDRAKAAKNSMALGIELPVLMDDAQVITEILGIRQLDETVLYKPDSFELLYRGPINGIEESIEKVLAGEDLDLVTVATPGQAIEFYNKSEHENLSYEKDIAPIIAENCANCHREGGIAPFAMNSSLAVQSWSPMIREAILTKRMPPGQVDNKVGHKMKNEMNLSDEETQKLVRWINAGAVVDSDNDPLTSLTWPTGKWSLGEPDLIIKVPEQLIPATGIVDYMDIPIDLGLKKDVWIKSSEVVPGNPAVLHHIVTTVIPPGGERDFQQIVIDLLASLPAERAHEIRAQLFADVASGKEPKISKILSEIPDADVSNLLSGGNGTDLGPIAGYAPGNSVLLNPPGVGGLLKAGTTLNLQMHYTTTGRETTDATEIGIYFYDEGVVPQERMSSGVANTFSINIPAKAKDHEMEIVTTIPQDAEIHSLMPHMHFRGKRMKFSAVYPDGSEELLLSVPAYSFNWQLKHTLKQPLLVSAGTKIVATGAFDNSAQNPFNPDPNIEINWGEQSWEEMFMAFYSWKNINQTGSEQKLLVDLK